MIEMESAVATRTKFSKFVAVLLKIGGQNVYEDTYYSKVVSPVLLAFLMIGLSLGIAEPFMHKPTMDSIVDSFELFGPYVQVKTFDVILELQVA